MGMHRIDAQSKPDIIRMQTYFSKQEVERLQEVKNVIRLGYVRTISEGHMLLDEGRVDVAPGALYIDCTGSRTRFQASPEPLWQSGRIKLQLISEGIHDVCM